MVLPALISFALLVFPALTARAAPCCAQTGSVPSLITGDERISMGASILNGSVIGDAPAAGGGVPVFRDALSTRESRSVLLLNAAALLDGDRLQAGISVPLQWNRIGSGSRDSSRVAAGDVSLTLGHETLPEWDYSVWKPRGFTFLQLTLPTGRSILESTDPAAVDVTGLGHVALSAGFVALKRWSVWDASSVIRLGRVFGRGFDSGISTRSAWSGAFNLGAGVSFAERFRLGGTIGVDALSALAVSGGGLDSAGAGRLVWTAGANLAWLRGEDDTLILGYADQTLFGPAYNTTLARTFSLSFMHRIER
jgi:hypothetical protein